MDPEATQPNEENNSADPAAQLAEANDKIARMSRELDDLQIEQKLAHQLAAAGAIDLETAVLVAKARMRGKAEAEIDGCVAQLRKEKAYLFGGPAESVGPRRTAPVRDRVAAGPAALEEAAQQATRTGSRADLHHYLKLRRRTF
jgi:hypothetical protein